MQFLKKSGQISRSGGYVPKKIILTVSQEHLCEISKLWYPHFKGLVAILKFQTDL